VIVVSVVALVSSEKLQDMPCTSEILIACVRVGVGSLSDYPVVDGLLDEDDLILEVVLLAFVLREGVGAAESDEEHHEYALPRCC
jgi:hypothetical protein